MLIVGGVLAAVPLAGLPPFYESFLYLVFHWIVLATSWNILSGYSGYFSFGHGAFFGAGMYTTATLASRFDVPFLWTLPAAALVAMLLGAGLGAVVFRVKAVRGELFALVTLAFTFVVGTIVLNTPIDGGPGVYLSAVPVPKIGPSAASAFYLMGLAAALATLAIAYAIQRSKLGLGLFAIHDDEDVAEVLGVPTFRCKMLAFAVSCGLAGVAGGIHALFVSYVTAGDTFTITVPLTVVLMSVLGGTRHWAGPAVGAAIITALLYAFTAGDHAIAGKAVFGAVLIVVILFMPQGVLGRFLERRRRAPAHASGPEASHAVAAAAPAVAPKRHGVGVGSHPRRPRHPQDLPRRARAGRHRHRRARRRDSRPRRTERLGQVDVHQRGQRALPARRRHARVSRRGHRARARPSDRRRRHRAHLPDPAPVRSPDRRRQRRACRRCSARRASSARAALQDAATLARIHRARGQGAVAAGRSQPAPAEIPRARARARVAAAAPAAGRGAVGPHARRRSKARSC